MVDRDKTVWTVVLILIAVIIWMVYQCYKRFYLPWKHQQGLVNLNQRMDTHESELATLRLNGYISDVTSSEELSSPESIRLNDIDEMYGQRVAEMFYREGTDSEQAETDRPPSYMDVTRTRNVFLSEPPSYEEATKQTDVD